MKIDSQHHLLAAAAAAALTAATGCATEPPTEPHLAEAPDPSAACVIPAIDVARSLLVSPTSQSEQTQLRTRFTVTRIMKHILDSSGAARPASGHELFRRWWDTQNRSTAAVFADNPHCDDGGGTINGYPVACPRNEGALATAQPDSHFPVALIYRPDLAARDGSTCGEARVLIAKPNDATGRNLAIFEAAIPNPEPGCGLAGCRKIAQFWASLSTNDSSPQRLDALERFFFTGLKQATDGVTTRPALDAANLGLPDAAGARRGQIRTNQFMTGPSPRVWQLREFQLARACTGTSCRLYFEPVSVKGNPWGALWNDADPSPLGPAFRADLLDQLPSLAAGDVNALGYALAGAYNAGQSNAGGTENRYTVHLGLGDPAGFRQAITDRLAALGISLTAEEIATRATTQSCGGCHQLTNNAALGGLDAAGAPLTWPPSAGFAHVLESGARSPALENVFLPRRRQLLTQLLLDTCATTCAAPSAGPSAALSAPDPTPLAGKHIVH
ncbi:MAG TPA: hypothetical protein VNO30_37435 [Kofleriaceae bacterium]|nr:hypothetical protein [Kofleriaceae bacterium]